MNSICIDIGNTSTKIGIFEGEVLVSVIKGLTFPEVLRICNKHLDHRIVVSNVATDFQHVYNLLEHKERLMMVGHDLNFPFQNRYQTPTTLGADRMAAVSGGIHLLPMQDLLVIQAGTCFTYDFVSAEAVYEGGGISPGLLMRFKALKEFTSKLPLVDMDLDFDLLVGQDTEGAIKSGVINGCVAELEGIIDRYVVKYPQVKVILTGGWANYFESKINRAKFAFQDLVLIGLNKILIHNNV